jgi:RND family efflux transporter MFP subunit
MSSSLIDPPARRSRLARWVTATAFHGVLLSLPLLVGCQRPGESAKEPPAPVPVRTEKAKLTTLQPSFTVIGTVLADPGKQATVTAGTSGLVEKLVAREGAKASAGDLLVQLDARKAKIDLDRAEAALARLIAKPRAEEVAQAQALLDKVKSAHGLAQARLQKAEELRKRSPELVPEVQLLDDQRAEQQARDEVDTARAALELLQKGPREEQRREARVEVDAARLQLDYCRVTAPFAGEVVEMLARVGARADVGTPLVRLLDTSEVQVQARVPGNRLAGIATSLQRAEKEGGDPVAEVRCIAFPGEVFPAPTGWLNRQTEATTGDVPIRLRVPNPRGLLRVGMTVLVELHEPPVEGVAIPEAAIAVNEEGHRVVTVVVDGKAVPTEVELADETHGEVRAGGWVRVLKGLEAGAEVTIENGYALPKDTPVTVLPPREEHP